MDSYQRYNSWTDVRSYESLNRSEDFSGGGDGHHQNYALRSCYSADSIFGPPPPSQPPVLKRQNAEIWDDGVPFPPIPQFERRTAGLVLPEMQQRLGLQLPLSGDDRGGREGDFEDDWDILPEIPSRVTGGFAAGVAEEQGEAVVEQRADRVEKANDLTNNVTVTEIVEQATESDISELPEYNQLLHEASQNLVTNVIKDAMQNTADGLLSMHDEEVENDLVLHSEGMDFAWRLPPLPQHFVPMTPSCLNFYEARFVRTAGMIGTVTMMASKRSAHRRICKKYMEQKYRYFNIVTGEELTEMESGRLLRQNYHVQIWEYDYDRMRNIKWQGTNEERRERFGDVILLCPCLLGKCER